GRARGGRRAASVEPPTRIALPPPPAVRNARSRPRGRRRLSRIDGPARGHHACIGSCATVPGVREGSTHVIANRASRDSRRGSITPVGEGQPPAKPFHVEVPIH